ncbi:MAG: hypothetical protein WC344_03190 [Bacilli bacterium]|jgi:hypothetical protein
MFSKTKISDLNSFALACISTVLVLGVVLSATSSLRQIVRANNQSEYSLSCDNEHNPIGGSYDSVTKAVGTSLGNEIYLSTKGLYSAYDADSALGQFRLSNTFGGTGLIYNSSPLQSLAALKIVFHPFDTYANSIQTSVFLSTSLLTNPTGEGTAISSGVDFPIDAGYKYFAIKVTSDFTSDTFENMVVVIDSLDIDYECESSPASGEFTYAFNDGATVIDSGTLPAGAAIPIPEEDPVKDADDDYTYSFVGYEGYAEGMRIYDDVEFTANFNKLAKDPYALMNSQNTLNINVGPRAKNTDPTDEFVFRHSSEVSTIGEASQYVSNYVTDFEGNIGDTITLPSYSRTINMMITGTTLASTEKTTYFGGLYLYAGIERETCGYTDPIGSSRYGAKKQIKIWNSTYRIDNLIFRDIVFHTRGALFQYGLANDYLNDPTSSIGYIRNIVFENCTFEDITSCNDQVMFIANNNNSYHTNMGGCLNFANTRNEGSIDVLGNTMTDLTLFEGSALTTRGLNNFTLSHNSISNIAWAIWMHSGYGITGSVRIDHNDFYNTVDKLLRVNTKLGHNLFESGNPDGTMVITHNIFRHAITTTSFIKFDNASTTSPIHPYQYEDGNRIFIDASNAFYFASETPLTAEELAAGSKNCGLHSGAGSTAYLDGLYINSL